MLTNIKVYENMLPDDERRFYPSYIPVLSWEPLRTNFIIPESPEEIKKGVVSLASFEKDDMIAQLTGFVLPFQNLHSLEHSEGIYYCDEFFAGYLIHSCNPSAYLRMSDFTLHALRNIPAFTAITIDYEATETKLHQPFNCKCFSDNCRGFIEGNRKEETK